MTLLLPWFPILLGVGIGGRLLGRKRGFALGFLCALFWVVLVQASVGTAIWQAPWTVITLIAGVMAIITIGGWAGETTTNAGPPEARTQAVVSDSTNSFSACDRAPLEQLCVAMDSFDDWLDDHRNDSDPWPQFDEFLRTVLYQCCRATHVKPYRLLSEGEELSPLHEPDPFTEVKRLSARKGIVGHVVTTGRSFVAGDKAQGELVCRLAEELSEPIAWCFAVKRGTARLGAVTVGQIDLPPDRNRELLRTVERLVTQFWCLLSETHRSRSAVLGDPVSGLLTREAFLKAAEQSLRESYDEGEPVAAGVIALEGLRALNDTGRWDVADDVVREVSGELRRKVRVDDRLGRFDGSRFVLLLRRVDSELASLIVSQLMSRLTRICGDEQRWRGAIDVRCGMVGSGVEKPELRTLISQAVTQCHRARVEHTPIASDLGPATVPAGSAS
jgi:diguanylate cyclase (GGDEF)-like protein